MKGMRKNKKSFTLVELLLVIAIIGVLATLIIVTVRSAQSRARDAKRVSVLEVLNTAIQTYYRETGHFPSLPAGCGTIIAGHPEFGRINSKSSNQVAATVSGSCLTSDFILGLAPSHISSLPQDPGPAQLSNGLNSRGFIYFHYFDQSKQLECYKILVRNPENGANGKYKNVWDPARDGGADNKQIDGTNISGWSLYSRGCAAK